MACPDPLITYIHPDVYPPSDDTYLLLDHFKYLFQDLKPKVLKEINNILDMGTGTGIIAIFFVRLVNQLKDLQAQIYASDILLQALECAKINEKANKISDNITYIQSDLFNSFPLSLKNTFEIIIFNPPYLPSFDPNEYDSQTMKEKDYSWNGGPKGSEVIRKFLHHAPAFLRNHPTSAIYYITSSRLDLDSLNRYIQNMGYKNEILRTCHIFFEDILLNRIKPYS